MQIPRLKPNLKIEARERAHPRAFPGRDGIWILVFLLMICGEAGFRNHMLLSCIAIMAMLTVLITMVRQVGFHASPVRSTLGAILVAAYVLALFSER